MQKYWWSVLGIFLLVSCTSSNDVQHALKKPKKACYGELGCFETGGDFFHPVYRPIDLLPQEREIINTKFNLYTKQNTREPYVLSVSDMEGLKQAPINKEVWTRFIVHGFLDTELFGKWQEVRCGKKYHVDQHKLTAMHQKNASEKEKAGRQPLFPSAGNAETCQDNFYSDLCAAMVATDFSWKKLENPGFKGFLEKYTEKSIPSESTLRKNYLQQLYPKALKNELLLHSDINCIIVDWSGGNKPPYAQATANTRVVGAEIALLVDKLSKTVGLDPEKVHIIGHSLGAHICGYAGERIKGLGRITGLDPAEPYFQNMATSVRLDPEDGDFVDIIHSDAKSILLLGLGMEQQVGHIDFYPNNGREQPGCKSSKITSFIISGLVEGGRRFVSCNHQRAIDFFMTTVNYKQCTPIGIGCKDWNTFLDGKCTSCGKDGSNCGIMGIRAYEHYPHKSNEVQPRKYLKTSGKSPFCLFHYVVSVKLYKAKGSKDQEGQIKITLNGQSKDAIVQLSEKDQKFYHGSTYQILYTTPTNLGNIVSVSFTWERKKTVLKPWEILKKHQLYVDYVKITPLNFIDEKERAENTKKYCYGKDKPIDDDKIATFIKC